VVLNLAGVDTKGAFGTGATKFDALQVRTTGPSLCDDLYVCNEAGAANNDFLGDVAVEVLRPNGNGAASGMVGSDGNSTDNWQLVDEAVVATADWVEGDNTGEKDTYAFTDSAFAAPSGCAGVIVFAHALKTDAGARTLRLVSRSGGAEATSADKALGTAYGWVSHVFETKPDGAAWTLADVAAAEFGVEARP
jgi:hypothetical protein